MPLIADLKTGWPEATPDQYHALQLHYRADCAASHDKNTSYRKALLDQIDHPDRVINLENTFRRRPTGYGPIQKIVSNLADHESPIRCQINVFAYAFLKNAKNYDMFMTADPKNLEQIGDQLKAWQKAVDALTEFERLGTPLDKTFASLEKTYLNLRAIVGRASARDERRTLTVLLVTGPATREEISEDLRLNYSLSQRVMTALVKTNALESRTNERYAINLKAMPVVLFLVRELMGLDMLEMLGDIVKESKNG